MVFRRTGGNTLYERNVMEKGNINIGDGNQITFCGFNQQLQIGDRDQAGRQKLRIAVLFFHFFL
jgi:hypothetical protein